MISHFFLKSVIALGILNKTLAIKTQDQANAICNRYQASYLAVMKPDGSDWGGCVPPPAPSTNICFEEEYTDPRTGAKGCCPDGKPYSYDPISLVGKCCPTGSPFSYDPVYNTGDCCGAGIAFRCSCGGAGSGTQALSSSDTCPGLSPDGTQKRIVGNTVYKFYCGKWVSVPQGLVRPSYKVPGGLQQCLQDCNATPSCQSVYYGFGNTLGANRVTECNLVGGTQSPPVGVNVDFVAALPDPPKAPVPIPMSVTDSCPDLGTDGARTRQEGNIVYKFWCGKWVVTSVGNVKPSYKVASLQKCLQDCNANAACKSIYYGFGNALGANRVGECNLVGAVENPPVGPPTGSNVDFVAAIPDPPKTT